MPRFAGGWIRVRQLEAHASRLSQEYKVKANGPHPAARSLSGGNLQNFIVGRAIGAKPEAWGRRAADW